MYAFASVGGVDDYLMRIPILSALTPMENLDFETLWSEGKPIEGQLLLKFWKLMSTPLDQFIDTNMLINVLVERAAKATNII